MGRFKLYKKFLGFYKVYCGLKEPLRILVDKQFLQETNRRCLSLPNLLLKIFNCKSTVCITNCIKNNLPSTFDYPQHIDIECKHQSPCTTNLCFNSLLEPFKGKLGTKIPYNYVIATMDQSLIEQYRHTRFPVITYDKQILKLCSPSPSLKRIYKVTLSKAKELTHEEKILAKKAEDEFHALMNEENKQMTGMQTHLNSLIKSKKPKGPNPLSILKKSLYKPQPTSLLSNLNRKVRRGSRGNQKAKKIRRFKLKSLLIASSLNETSSSL
ncbi:hypothetical protein EHI8A_147120 [Entamoeba histolytica HM-1:IMSS-B]|uniref:UTP23 sensor motif region domain-containing protein n=5 Tax=Entamoeba histolytica TaxID=5759 RepID=C4LWW1_ENTH1|nr:hypothetical protein EHI_199160 [Entamoeba histolytica HM-1:IMSS]EMD48927.1 Hypothetical protein EHI5A_119390 [Entamoeba histolytica KU27]EMH75580.1 hypothetical protein EHI8A_147120 [Entamoeba histolytica HM-1:IMSS-B]EMS16243.1 hypothetical protein KM1_024420 [Entamoeba histolytica HM-3:IMSS]GAT93205.1 hypothetical protein CL6EHI_199160 [Entamoeba histolytica]EAL47925.1 hypothetical protein EHI_199160 [Entamoeba histolytica HM-1:IMSS]|eukprot:XP_653313.1 hypothetical protein EHI_199160 [Entamoeba histolytica HM-1:IMSS]